jgi:hypothetical protein
VNTGALRIYPSIVWLLRFLRCYDHLANQITQLPFSFSFLLPSLQFPIVQFHLIHETLRGKEKIEDYEVYKDRRDDSVVAFARLGKLLSGHPDIIHGGSIAALLDNTMGVAFFAAKVSGT